MASNLDGLRESSMVSGSALVSRTATSASSELQPDAKAWSARRALYMLLSDMLRSSIRKMSERSRPLAGGRGRRKLGIDTCGRLTTEEGGVLDPPRLPVHQEPEVLRPQVRHGPALRVGHADVDPDEVQTELDHRRRALC